VSAVDRKHFKDQTGVTTVCGRAFR